MINGQIQPSMAALLSENSELGDRTFVPDWSIDVQRIPRFSFIDVIQGRMPGEGPRRQARDRRRHRNRAWRPLRDPAVRHRPRCGRSGAGSGIAAPASRAEAIGIAADARRTAPRYRAFLIASFRPRLWRSSLRQRLLGRSSGRYPSSSSARFPLSIDTAPLSWLRPRGLVFGQSVEARHRIRLAALRDLETGLANEPCALEIRR